MDDNIVYEDDLPSMGGYSSYSYYRNQLRKRNQPQPADPLLEVHCNSSQNIDSHIEEILQEVGREDGNTIPKNIAIIGPPGVGKSGLNNTIIAAFSRDKWIEKAYSGNFGSTGRAVTAVIKR